MSEVPPVPLSIKSWRNRIPRSAIACAGIGNPSGRKADTRARMSAFSASESGFTPKAQPTRRTYISGVFGGTSR